LFGGKLATVWSAPNYCYRFENLASILELDENLNEYFNIFEDAPENKKKKEDPGKTGFSSSTASSSDRKMRPVYAVDGDNFFL